MSAEPVGRAAPKVFLALWACQLSSLLGSDIVNFSLRVYTYQHTKTVTSFGLITFWAEAPALLLAPFMGVLVDRLSRKSLLIASDAISALVTLCIALLYAHGTLEPHHIYVANAITSIMSAIQWPAFKATVSLLIHPDDLVRFGGLDQAAPALSQLLGPFAAGLLVDKFGLVGAFTAEFITFTAAMSITLFVTIPQPKSTKAGDTGRGNMWSEAYTAWQFIWERKGLVGLLMLLANGQLTSGMVRVLMTPVLLNMADQKVMGYVLSASGLGAIFGSIALTVTGGPKGRKVMSVLACAALQGVFLSMCGLTQSSLVMLAISTMYMSLIPLNRACRESIWQRKVPADLQGRVFGLQRLIAEASVPLVALVSGPLVDNIFEPRMQPGGSLSKTLLGRAVGTGPGRGSAITFVVLGSFNVLAALIGLASPSLRNVESDLVDAVGLPGDKVEHDPLKNKGD